MSDQVTHEQSPTRERILQEMKEAMRAHAQERLNTIRFLLAAIKQKEIDERITLNESQVIAVIEKMVKQHKDAIAQFQSADRDDLVQKEQSELTLLKTFLPEQMSDSELNTIIQKAIAESGASSIRDMGKVMGIIKPQIQGKADIGEVSAKIKAQLSAA